MVKVKLISLHAQAHTHILHSVWLQHSNRATAFWPGPLESWWVAKKYCSGMHGAESHSDPRQWTYGGHIEASGISLPFWSSGSMTRRASEISIGLRGFSPMASNLDSPQLHSKRSLGCAPDLFYLMPFQSWLDCKIFRTYSFASVKIIDSILKPFISLCYHNG